MPATKKRSVRRDAKRTKSPRSPLESRPRPEIDEPILHADKPTDAPAPAPLVSRVKVRAPAPPSPFPPRADAPGSLPISTARVWVNGNAKTADDGVKSEMTAAEIAALDGVDAQRFVRLDWHVGQGTNVVERPGDVVRMQDGMYFTVQRH